MAKAAKTTKTTTAEPADEATVIPAPLAAAVEEQDTVLQAHFTRQANHFNDLAPKIAKQTREDEERENRIQEHEIIAERNRKERERAEADRLAREERETAGEKAAALRAEIDALKVSIEDKTAEAERLEKLAEGK